MPLRPRLRPRWRAPKTARTSSGVDRKSTRLNSSHANNSYAVFCLKKKKQKCPNYASRSRDGKTRCRTEPTRADRRVRRSCRQGTNESAIGGEKRGVKAKVM